MKTLQKFLLATLVMLSVGVCFAQDTDVGTDAEYSTIINVDAVAEMPVDVILTEDNIVATIDLNQTTFSVKEQCANDAPLLIDFGCSNEVVWSRISKQNSYSISGEIFKNKYRNCNSDFKVGWQS